MRVDPVSYEDRRLKAVYLAQKLGLKAPYTKSIKALTEFLNSQGYWYVDSEWVLKP